MEQSDFNLSHLNAHNFANLCIIVTNLVKIKANIRVESSVYIKGSEFSFLKFVSFFVELE